MQFVCVGTTIFHAEHLHDVGFVNSRDAVPVVVPGVLKSILGNAATGVLSDQLDTLHYAINDLTDERQKYRNTDR